MTTLPFSEQESNLRLANLVTSYGVGTRSYNRSAEKREMDRQRKGVTEAYLAAREQVVQGSIRRFVERAEANGIPVQQRKDGPYVQCREATFQYLAGPSVEVEIPVMCRCLQRSYPHDLSVHRQTVGEYWRDKEKRGVWPWSLVKSERVSDAG